MATGRTSPSADVRADSRISLAYVLAESIRGFDPRREIRHPVMFTVYVLFLFILVVMLDPGLFPDLTVGYDKIYYLGTAVLLFATLWFANLSEGIAEAQGRAQAESLRQIRGGLRARRLDPAGTESAVPVETLRIGDVFVVPQGETIPMDGDVVHGAAQIDESMLTGESQTVLRESGGDRTSVLGGSRVAEGEIQVRVSALQGQSFLDRLIRLVESTTREKTPNEIALNVLLSALSLALFIVVLGLVYLCQLTGYAAIDVATASSLLVSLLPTTIGGLLPAIGISGINRVAEANVIAKSGKAVEAAGDLDVLILDKTGTITTGNRLAVQLVPAPEVEMGDLLTAALVGSSLDDTPEGRSIVRLAARRSAQSVRLEPGSFRVVPFSAERRMSGIVLADGTEIYKGSVSAIQDYAGELPPTLANAATEGARQGMTVLVIARSKRTLGLVYLKDVVKPGIKERLAELRRMGIRTVMCTGDNRLTAATIAKEAGVDDFIAEARPEAKLLLINREKAQGRLVAMTGDGTNDAPALARADVGLAMNSGTSAAKEAGNMVDLDSDPTKLIQVVSIGKQLLITRGALTTFSITNDVAKYFAIIPVLFATAGGGFVGVRALNVLGLSSPHLAVLATVLFNALMIPTLIPLALRGVPFRPRSAIDLLRQNLLLYGIGGLASAFVGIKAVYIVLEWLGRIPAWQSLLSALAHFLPGGFL
ncbi:MAG: potassium-transporting ATPase subunit KdpB [Thermoplasmata archaeon]|nr:potassium-transporting ATPase subunit KdpB [Thermoplasmata archaeon]